MPKFFYKVKSKKGSLKKGVIFAENKKEAFEKLKEKNFEILKLEEKIDKFFKPKKKVKLLEKIFFTRHLKLMIKSGYPFEKALDLLASQTKNEFFGEIIFKIKRKVFRGESFSKALKDYKNIFGEYYVNMIKVGEESGRLEEVLENLETQMKKEYELITEIKGAMIYPAVVLFVLVVVGILMMIFVLPKFSALFKEINIPLPLTTKLIIAFGDLFSKYGLYFIGALFIFFYLLKKFFSTKKGKKFLNWLSLKLPFISGVTKKVSTARTARILSSLLKSGISVIKSLEILKETLPNYYYQKAFEDISKKIQQGKEIYFSFSLHEELFSFLLVPLMEVGEKTGNLENVLEEIAQFHEKEVEDLTKNLSSLIEPLLIVIIGGIIGFVAIAVLQPIYSSMGAL